MATVNEEIYDTSSGEDEPDADDEIIVVPFVKPPPTLITILEESDNETESSRRKRSTAKSGGQNNVQQEQLVQKKTRQFEGNNDGVPASNILLPSVSALADQLTLTSTQKTNSTSSVKRAVNYSESSSANTSKRKRKATATDTRQKSVSPEPDPSSVSAQQDPYPAKWTPEMKRFYGEELRTPNLFRIQRRQSSDYRKWRTMEDQCRVRKRRVHIKCGNCSQRGHHASECPQQPKANLCFMCGLEGHQMQHCSRAVCLNCGSKQSFFVQSCTNCVENFQIPVRCAHCGIEGHRDSMCPDHWRRFHAASLRTRRESKTGQMKLKILVNRQSFKAKNRSSCANCGRLGHNYFQCKGTKRPNPYFVNTPEIVQKLTLEEAEKVVIRARSESEFITPPNQEVENSVSSGNEEEAQLESPDDGFPSLPLENETIVRLTESEREVLLKSYQSRSKKSTMYSFFNTHSANIVKIVNHEEDNSVHVHINGSDKLTVKEVVSGLRQLLEGAEVKEEMTDLTEDDDDDGGEQELAGSTGSPDFKYNFLNSQMDGESSDEADDPDISEPCPEVWELNQADSDSEIIEDDEDHEDESDAEEEEEGDDEDEDDEIEIIGEVVRTPSSSQDSTDRDAEANTGGVPVPTAELSATAERIDYGETELLKITTKHWFELNSHPISLITKIEQALAVHITLLHDSFDKKLLRIHGSSQLCRRLAKIAIFGWMNSRNGRSLPCSFVGEIISMRIKYGLTRTEDDIIQNPWFEFANRSTILLHADPEPNFPTILKYIKNNVKKIVRFKFDGPSRKIELKNGVNNVQKFSLKIWLSTYFKCTHGNESYADQIMGELSKWENDPRFALIYLGDELLRSILPQQVQKQVHEETQGRIIIDLPLLASERRVLEEENRKNSILQVLEEYFQVKVKLLHKEIILHNCGMDFKYVRIQGDSGDGRLERLAQASILGFLERKRLKGEIMVTEEEEEELDQLESVGEDGARIQLALNEWHYLNRNPPCFPSSYISQLKAIYGVQDKLEHISYDEKILCLEGGRKRNQMLGIAYIFAHLDKYRGGGQLPTVSVATTNQQTAQEKKVKKSLNNDKNNPTGSNYSRELSLVHLNWIEERCADSFKELISTCNRRNDDWNLHWFVRRTKTGVSFLHVTSTKEGIQRKVKLAIKRWFSRKTLLKRQKKTKPTRNAKNNRNMKEKKESPNNRNRRLDEGDEGRNLGNENDEESTASGHSHNLRSRNCSSNKTTVDKSLPTTYLMYQRTKAKYLKNSNNRKTKIESTEPDDAAPPRKISKKKKALEKTNKRKRQKKKLKNTDKE